MNTTTAIRVLIVDDHAIVRDGLQEVLDRAADLQVVGQAVDGAEALAIASEVRRTKPIATTQGTPTRSVPLSRRSHQCRAEGCKGAASSWA